MKLKTVQWNVGGSLIRREDDDPTSRGVYNTESVGYIVERLGEYDADIVTLQETHSDDTREQTQEIADQLGYQTHVNHRYAPSHLTAWQWLGQAVLSRHPLDNVDDAQSTSFEHDEPASFTALNHRTWSAEQPNGERWHWMNKGISVVRLALSDAGSFSVSTLHFPVFKRLGVEPSSPEASSVLKEAQGIILSRVGATALLQGDFNIDHPSMRGYLYDLFSCNFTQHLQKEPTTPTGKHYDHVLARGARILSSHTDNSVLTDHYPLVTELEI